MSIGIAKAMQGDMKSAVEEFAAVTRSHPNAIEAYRNLAQAQWLAGVYKNARQSYDKLESIDAAGKPKYWRI